MNEIENKAVEAAEIKTIYPGGRVVSSVDQEIKAAYEKGAKYVIETLKFRMTGHVDTMVPDKFADGANRRREEVLEILAKMLEP